MKKVLFATTALVMTAGVAAAEVSVGGNGRMGIVYDGDYAQFSSRARIEFTLSGQTDGGLDFGGFFRAQDAADAASGTAGSVYVSGAFGKLEMGDVVSAPEALFGDLPEVGYEDLTYATVYSNDIPYLTLDDGTQSALLYTYTVGGFSIAASMTDGIDRNGYGYYDTDEDPSTEPEWVDTKTVDKNKIYGLAASYTFGNYTVGLGYEVADPDGPGKSTQTELAGVATFGDTSVKGYYAVGGDDNAVDEAYGLGVSSKFDAITVMGYAQHISGVDKADDITWYGLGASYDLGGGASLAAGIMDSDVDGTDPKADFGIKFTF